MNKKQNDAEEESMQKILTDNQMKLMEIDGEMAPRRRYRGRKNIRANASGSRILYDCNTWSTLSSKQWRELDAVSVRRLISCGWNPRSVDNHGATVLHRMARKSSVSAICEVVSYGAKVDALNSHGLTPFDVAVRSENLKNARVLKSLSASEQSKDTGASLEEGSVASSPVLRARHKSRVLALREEKRKVKQQEKGN